MPSVAHAPAHQNTPPKSTIASLEIGRFIAASIVVITHVFSYLANDAASPTTIFAQINPPAAIAVQYFFVLSGFVMMTAHRRDFGKLTSAPRFWWRRACRIYPMYWIALALAIPFLYRGFTPDLALKLFTLQPANSQDWVPPAWSLRYEIAFYIAFGLCLLPYIGRLILALWIILAAYVWCPETWLAVINIPPPYALTQFSIHHMSYFLAPFEFFFFAGLAGGRAFDRFHFGTKTNLIMAASGLIFLICAYPALDWGKSYGLAQLDPFTGLAFAAIMAGLGGLERQKPFPLSNLARTLGTISYPLYILHASVMLIFSLCAPPLKLSNLALYFLFIFIMAGLYAISAATAFWIDQPLQRLLRRTTQKIPTLPRPKLQLHSPQ